ncbi:MAG: hypothetical protein ACFE85_14155 [Candidatus Hodarchaeota archaeon]
MSDQLKLLLYIKDMVSDLIYINSIIASELIKITENTAALRYGQDFLNTSSCVSEHHELSEHLINIVGKYNKSPADFERKNSLEKHILKHKS